MEPARVRFISIAPSPYTHRHDALRAGMGIFQSLRALIEEQRLALEASFCDGVPVADDAETGAKLLRGAGVLIFGGSAWAQGSSHLLRRYFELVGAEYLGGVSGTAWVTAGGAHTGGEVVVWDILRSLLGMGAQVFSLGQKLMVFTMDEREAAPGEFTLLDCWYMDQFARNLAVVALAGHSRDRAAALSKQFGVSTQFYTHLPRDAAELEHRYGGLRHWLNAAADARSPEFAELRGMLSAVR